MSDSTTPWTVAHQVPLSKEFSRQGHWSGLPFPSPGDLSNPGIMPRYPAPWTDSSLFEPLETLRENSMELQADSLPSEPPEMLRENSYGSSLKTTITIWSSSLIPGRVSGENSNSERHMHTNVHCSTVYNSKDMGATKVSTDRGMDKDVGHIYNEILLSHKKGWNNTICSNMNGPRDYHTKWSQSGRDIYHAIVHICKSWTMMQMNLFTKQNHRYRRQT